MVVREAHTDVHADNDIVLENYRFKREIVVVLSQLGFVTLLFGAQLRLEI